MNWIRRYPSRFLWRLFYVALVLSLVLDLVFLYRRLLHYHFAFQYQPEFFAIFGLIGCMLLIVIAKVLGLFIVTDEDYYERRSRR